MGKKQIISFSSSSLSNPDFDGADAACNRWLEENAERITVLGFSTLGYPQGVLGTSGYRITVLYEER